MTTRRVELTDPMFEGHVSLERGDGWVKPWRLPLDLLDLFPTREQIVASAATPAGVRLRFETESDRIALAVDPVDEDEPRQFDLTIDGDLAQTASVRRGEGHAVFDAIPGGRKVVELWLPQRRLVALSHLDVDGGCEVRVVPDTRPRWVTYGSSITHCGGATVRHGPGRRWWRQRRAEPDVSRVWRKLPPRADGGHDDS